MNTEENILVNGKKDEEYNMYLKVRGYGVYQVVYQAISLLSKDEFVNIEDFKGLIRYDKRLRDNLYRYLATVEEYLKSEIWNRLKYTGNKTITKLDNYTLDRLEHSEKFDYNFFKHSSFDFSTICNLNDRFQLGYDKTDLTNIRLLRNKVMHHNFLLIDCHKEVTIVAISDNLSNINTHLKSLYKILPPNWNESFKNSVNRSNLNKENNQLLSKYINIEVM